MTVLTALAFTAAAAVIVVVPGPDQALLLQLSAAAGRPAAVRAAAGILLGIALWGVASIAGLSAVLVDGSAAFRVVTVLSAAYLAWLGVRALHAARWPALPEQEVVNGSSGRFFLRGLLMNCLNPKIGLFYLSILPQFVPSSATSTVGAELVLSAIYLAVSALWLFGFAFVAARLHPLLVRPQVRRPLELMVGLIFLVLGIAALVSL